MHIGGRQRAQPRLVLRGWIAVTQSTATIDRFGKVGFGRAPAMGSQGRLRELRLTGRRTKAQYTNDALDASISSMALALAELL